MFTYLDASENRPSLAALMELYWRTMPAYQVRSWRDNASENGAAPAFAWSDPELRSGQLRVKRQGQGVNLGCIPPSLRLCQAAVAHGRPARMTGS